MNIPEQAALCGYVSDLLSARRQVYSDYWSEFTDQSDPSPIVLTTGLTPVNENCIADLKRFVCNASRYGYLPTRRNVSFVNRKIVSELTGGEGL
jgi:hypothetical protein